MQGFEYFSDNYTISQHELSDFYYESSVTLFV